MGKITEGKISPNQAVMVGDSLTDDIVPAYQLGIRTVHMTTIPGQQYGAQITLDPNKDYHRLPEVVRSFG